MAKQDKAARLPRLFDYAKSFRKDWERLSRSGRYNMAQLKEAMLLLIANDAPLSAEWRDHALKGEWAGTRQCHIGGDFLLIYQLDEAVSPAGMPAGMIVFIRAGTHSELFK
jgi:mRNA interferase YafQ